MSPRAGSGLSSAIAFLTPLGSAAPPRPSALPWFPIVGGAIGAVLGLVWWGAGNAFGPAVAGVLVVVADLLATGMLHMDGCADTADGLLPHVGDAEGTDGRDGAVERRLEIMADPATGAFGVTVLVAVMLARFAGIATVHVAWDRSVLLLAGLWSASRALMAFGVLTMPYARAEGLASAFGGGTGAVSGGTVHIRNPAHFSALVLLLAAAVIAAIGFSPRGGIAAVGAGLAAGIGVLVFAQRRIGGFTGDILGAAGVVLESVGVLVASAHW